MPLKNEPVAQLAALAAALATFAPQERIDGAYALYEGARNMLVGVAVGELRRMAPAVASVQWEREHEIDDSGRAYEFVENVELHLSGGGIIAMGSLADMRQERDYGFLAEAEHTARLEELEETHGEAAPEALLAELVGMKREDDPALLDALGTIVSLMASIRLVLWQCSDAMLCEQLNGMPEHLRLLRGAGGIAPATAILAPC